MFSNHLNEFCKQPKCTSGGLTHELPVVPGKWWDIWTTKVYLRWADPRASTWKMVGYLNNQSVPKEGWPMSYCTTWKMVGYLKPSTERTYLLMETPPKMTAVYSSPVLCTVEQNSNGPICQNRQVSIWIQNLT